MKSVFLAVSLSLLSLSSFAWDGTDSETGASVEIEPGTLVRSGISVDYFDYNAGEYKSATVEAVRRVGRTVKVDVIDDDTGEARTLEMDGE